MTRLGDISGVWSTIREIDVGEIREEAEHPVTFGLIGESELREAVSLVIEGRAGRFPSAGLGALVEYPLPVPLRDRSQLSDATVIILVFDARRAPALDLEGATALIASLTVPIVTVCIGADRLPQGGNGAALALPSSSTIFLPEATSADLGGQLIPKLVDLTPNEQQVAVARSFPGMREGVARKLIGDAAFSNAAYALTAALPELIPVLNLPLNAADLLVLTKNQALMVYKLGLAFGAPGDFQAQMREILPVIGGGFVWRQVARQFIGLVPGFGLLPKVAVAYAGTYVVGQVATAWYQRGEVLSKGAMSRLYKQAWAIGRQRAADLLARRRAGGGPAQDGLLRRTARRVRRFLPWRKGSPPPPQLEAATEPFEPPLET